MVRVGFLLWLALQIGTGAAESITNLVSAANSSVSWADRLNQLWRQSKTDKLENGATYAITDSGQGYWLPNGSKKQLPGSFSATINWSQVKDLDRLGRAFDVHTHPPRTWKHYKETVLDDRSLDEFDGRFIADPPSLDDVLINFGKHLKLPPHLQGRVKFTGVALNMGGAWVWEKDPNAPTLTPNVFNERAEALKKAVAKFVRLSAKFDGQTERMLNDSSGYESYRNVVAGFQSLGIKVRFFKAQDLTKIIEPSGTSTGQPASGAFR